MYKRKCLMCGKEFLRECNSRKYCSEECKRKYYKSIKNPEKNLVCEYCRKAFTSPCERKYCSFECCVLANPAKEKISKTSSEIKQIPITNKKKNKPFVSLNEMAVLQNKTGISYGQLAHKMEAGKYEI